MSDTTNDFKIPNHSKGTTWDGISFLVTDEIDATNQQPVDFTGASIVAQFKKGKSGATVFEFKTSDNTIVFGTGQTSDPTTGEIVLKPRLMNYPAYNYYFTVRATFPGDRVDEIVEGYFNLEE